VRAMLIMLLPSGNHDSRVPDGRSLWIARRLPQSSLFEQPCFDLFVSNGFF
jgi:hypothetical protein